MMPARFHIEILNFLQISFHIIKLLQQRQQKHKIIHVDFQLLHIMALSRDLYLNYINLLHIISKYIKIRKRKKRWSKPAILITLMDSYR